MVKSSTTSITPAQHAANHSVGGTDPLVAPILLESHETTHVEGGTDTIPRDMTMNTVTGSRALSTIYRNNTGHVMHVACAISQGGASVGAGNALIDSFTPPTTARSTAYATGGFYGNMSFSVPDGYYYQVTWAGSPALLMWTEWTVT